MNDKYLMFNVGHVTENIEPFEQYCTFGKDLHTIMVMKPVIATKKGDGYFVKGKKVEVFDNNKISHSYTTQASLISSIAGAGCIPSGVLEMCGINATNSFRLDRFGRRAMAEAGYGFPISMDDLSLVDMAKIAVKTHKPVFLSEDPSEARDQLADLCIELPEPTAEDCAEMN